MVRQRCEARPLLLEHGEDFVLYALLDFVTENYQPVSEAIHGEIEALEESVLGGSLRKTTSAACTACAVTSCACAATWHPWLK